VKSWSWSAAVSHMGLAGLASLAAPGSPGLVRTLSEGGELGDL
jgi:hypothetical protein